MKPVFVNFLTSNYTMNLKFYYRILIIILFMLSISLISDETKINYQMYVNTEKFGQMTRQTGRFDCTKFDPCQIPFREDYKDYLDLKYNHKKKLIYQMDKGGYYYLTYNPKKANSFDLQVRVRFNQIKSENKMAEIGIDTETQSGAVYFYNAGNGNPSWKYLLAETPTLSPIVQSGQILVAADHPIEGGKLYSINAKTGKLEWFFLTPGAILMYPVFFENSIIIIDDSGNIFWINRETGLMTKKYILEEFPLPNPILKDKILYLSTKRGYIYAIKLGDGYPAWKDLALIGDVSEMHAQKRGIVLLGNNQYWLFNYTNGAKQDKITGGHSTD